MASYKELDANKVPRYLGIAFTGIGAIMLIVFIGMAIRMLAVTSSYEKINSTIYDITYTKNNDGESQKRVTVEYRLGGEMYQQVLPSTDSSMRVGQTVAIYVDPDDPKSIETVEFFVIMLAVNGRKAYHVKANWTDELGAEHELKSRLTFTDPNLYIAEGDEIQVYIDPKNYKHYHVCLEELEEKFVQEAGDEP